MNGKCQVEVEAVAAVGVVLLFFVLGMVLVTIRNNEVNALQEVQFKEAQCRKVSEIIGFLNARQGSQEIFFRLNEDANISQGEVIVGSVFCRHLGSAAEAQLSSGKVKASEVNGAVVLENV